MVFTKLTRYFSNDFDYFSRENNSSVTEFHGKKRNKLSWTNFTKMGVAMFEFGSAPYLSGAMENFLYHTNITNGEVQGCLLPSGGTGTIFHAKPVVIQGAWLAAQEIDHQHYHHHQHQQQNNNNNEKTMYFKRYAKQMAALLKYWTSNIRLDQATQLPKWYNQLESGQDNLP